MTAHSKPFPVFETLATTFSDWLKHRREMNELRQLNTLNSTASPTNSGFPRAT